MQDLAKFLKDQLNYVVADLKSGEGVPTDSQSLQDLLHKSGINMRYLGQLY